MKTGRPMNGVDVAVEVGGKGVAVSVGGSGVLVGTTGAGVFVGSSGCGVLVGPPLRSSGKTYMSQMTCWPSPTSISKPGALPTENGGASDPTTEHQVCHSTKS